jgi:hypothetical protein
MKDAELPCLLVLILHKEMLSEERDAHQSWCKSRISVGCPELYESSAIKVPTWPKIRRDAGKEAGNDEDSFRVAAAALAVRQLLRQRYSAAYPRKVQRRAV